MLRDSESKLTVYIQGQVIPNDRIEAWEYKRAAKVLRKIGVPSVKLTLAERRQQLAQRKEELGHAGIRPLLSREIALSDMFAKGIVWASGGRRRFSVIEILSSSGTAEGFSQWFEDAAHRNREDVMLAATPDHYLIATGADGRQEVIETNGGAPLTARFFVDYADLSSLKSKADPTFPIAVAGVARADDGTAIGGVRHQFRDEDAGNGQGFRARLTVEFPLLILPGVVGGHRWHLASEFSNWIRAYLVEEAVGASRAESVTP